MLERQKPHLSFECSEKAGLRRFAVVSRHGQGGSSWTERCCIGSRLQLSDGFFDVLLQTSIVKVLRCPIWPCLLINILSEFHSVAVPAR